MTLVTSWPYMIFSIIQAKPSQKELLSDSLFMEEILHVKITSPFIHDFSSPFFPQCQMHAESKTLQKDF